MPKNTDIFKKMNNHSLPIDESYWAEMEARLQNDRKKVIPLWAWFAGTGIAASLALLLTVNIGTQMTQILRLRSAQVTQISADNTIISNEQVIEIQGIETKSIQISANNTTNKKLNSPKQKNPSKSASLVLSVVEASAFQKIENNDTLINNIVQAEENTETPTKQYELKPKYDDLLIAQNEPEKEKSQNKKSWQIAAAFSSGTSNFSNNNFYANNDLDYSKEMPDRNNNTFSPNGNYAVNEEKSTPSIDEIYQDFSEVTHLPPLSFGLTVRKNLNKYLAVETGLTYSFLQSKFKENNEWQQRDATLKLHYIGFPLNAVVYLVNKPKWNVYFSLGGMMEKGIMMDYVQHTTYKNPYYIDYNQPIYNVSLQDKIPELQWSLNTSFGVAYKFYREFGIYFEPRILYYFKNNQPVSVRTEMPLIVGLNAGLRFEF